MPAVVSKLGNENETFTITAHEAFLLGLRPLPHVGKGKRETFYKLLANAGVEVGGPLYRDGEGKPFFFTNTTFRDWLKEKAIAFHPEQVFTNLLWWLRGLPMSRLRYSLYLALGRKTKRGTTHKVVEFDPNAPSSVRQSYKGVWAIAGSPQLFAFLEDSLRGVPSVLPRRLWGVSISFTLATGGNLFVSLASPLRSCAPVWVGKETLRSLSRSCTPNLVWRVETTRPSSRWSTTASTLQMISHWCSRPCPWHRTDTFALLWNVCRSLSPIFPPQETGSHSGSS